MRRGRLLRRHHQDYEDDSSHSTQPTAPHCDARPHAATPHCSTAPHAAQPHATAPHERGHFDPADFLSDVEFEKQFPGMKANVGIGRHYQAPACTLQTAHACGHHDAPTSCGAHPSRLVRPDDGNQVTNQPHPAQEQHPQSHPQQGGLLPSREAHEGRDANPFIQMPDYNNYLAPSGPPPYDSLSGQPDANVRMPEPLFTLPSGDLPSVSPAAQPGAASALPGAASILLPAAVLAAASVASSGPSPSVQPGVNVNVPHQTYAPPSGPPPSNSPHRQEYVPPSGPPPNAPGVGHARQDVVPIGGGVSNVKYEPKPSNEPHSFSHIPKMASAHDEHTDPALFEEAAQQLHKSAQMNHPLYGPKDHEAQIAAHAQAYGSNAQESSMPMDPDTIGMAAAVEAMKMTAAEYDGKPPSKVAATRPSPSPSPGPVSSAPSQKPNKPKEDTSGVANAMQNLKVASPSPSRPRPGPPKTGGKANESGEPLRTPTPASPPSSPGPPSSPQDKLVALAVAQAAKLFDRKNGGSPLSPAAKQAKVQALNSAASTVLRLASQYKMSGKVSLQPGELQSLIGTALSIF